MKKKRIIAATAAAVLLVSTALMPAGAETVDWTLTKDHISSESKIVGLYLYGSVDYLKNDSSSSDGVNLYLDYAVPGANWENRIHLFCDPGKTDSATGKYKARVPSSWKGRMCSWWALGRNCLSYGRFRAYN